MQLYDSLEAQRHADIAARMLHSIALRIELTGTYPRDYDAGLRYHIECVARCMGLRVSVADDAIMLPVHPGILPTHAGAAE